MMIMRGQLPGSNRMARWIEMVGIGNVVKGSVACVVLSIPAAAFGQIDLRLAPGDSISFSVVGSPALDRVATIGPEGAVYLPVVGKVQARGRTLDELQNLVANTISERAFRVSGSTGEDVWSQIQPEDVIIDVAEYRPIFVTGDVRAGGQIPFRPGMTARQAIAIAGGVGLALTEGDLTGELLNVSAQRDLLILGIQNQQNLVERLKADLDALDDALAKDDDTGDGGEKAAPADAVESTAVEVGDGIETVEEAGSFWLEARAELRDLMASNVRLRLEQMRGRLQALEQLQQADAENLSLEQEEYERVRQLVDRGVLPASSLADARRGLLQASSRMLESSQQLFQLRLDIAQTEDEIRLERTGERIELLSEITAQLADLASARQQLRALDDRMVRLGATAFIGSGEPTVDMDLYRMGAEDVIPVADEPDILLFPGDVLEVTAALSEQELGTE